MRDIRKLLEETPGIQFEVMTFLGDRISESISGETSPVVINLFGEELDLLDKKAEEIAAVVRSVEGAADVQVKAPPGAPRISIRLRQERIAELGFRPVEVLEAIQTAYQGTVVAQTYRANQFSDVVVIMDTPNRQNPSDIGGLLLRNALGGMWPLRELAHVYRSTGRS